MPPIAFFQMYFIELTPCQPPKDYLANPESEIRGGFREIPDRGAAGPRVDKTYPVGTILTRYGSEGGEFLAEGDPPKWARSLSDDASSDKRTYRVKQAFTAKSSRALPAYGKPGGCKQVDLDGRSVLQMKADYLEDY